MTWAEKTALLEKELNFRHLFEVLCLEKEKTFAIWLEDGEVKTYDYAYLENRSFAVSENIQKLNFGEKDGWTGIAVDTCKEWPIIFWGLLSAGRKALLLDPSLDDKGIDHLMKQAGADSLVTRRKRALPYAQLTPEEVMGNSDAPSASYKPDWADLVAACTSGTTSTSRVYVYNGEAMCRQVIGFSHHQPYPCLTYEGAGEIKTVSFLPLNHIFGILTNVITTPFQNYPQIYLKDRAPQTIMETCRKCGAQMILTVPLLVNSISNTITKKVSEQSCFKRTAFKFMSWLSLTCQRINPRWGLKVGKKLFKSVNANLFGDSMMQIVVGGAHVPVKHLKTVNALGYAVTVGFGMTETAITSYENKIDLKTRLSGSVGLPLPISEYKVVPDGNDPNRGELRIKCNAMHIGRLENGVMLPPSLDEDGWFATGDIVRIGDKGRMWIEGRIKDVIIGESGENVYPDEIEDTFAGIEGVEQLAVFGLKKNNDELVTLIMNVGGKYDDNIFLTRLASQIDKRNRTLRPLKRARMILVTSDELPTANTIKVKRAAIRDGVENGKIRYKNLSVGENVLTYDVAKAGMTETEKTENVNTKTFVPSANADESIKQKIKECFAEELDIDINLIKDDSTFTDDLSGDSLHRIGALIKVESEFGIQIPEEAYEYCTTVSDLANVVAKLREGKEIKAEEKNTVVKVTDFTESEEYKNFVSRFADMEKAKNPYFICHESPLKDTSLMDGREVLNFGSYNYVGMSGRKEVNEAAKAAIDKYGTSASGSRLLAGEKMLHRELEKEIAEWKHAEDALVLVGGHSTNVTIVGNFCVKGDLILYDAIIHNSVHEGCRLSDADSKAFPHNDYKALEEILKNLRDKYSKVLIVVEGVYSMDGDIAPIPEYVALKKKYGCFLMVDEAHSACVIGRTGGGVDEYFGLDGRDIDIKMGTLSKGLGTCGGYVAGPRPIIEYFRYNVPGFVFSVGMSPALAGASLEAIRLLRRDPSIMENMRRNIDVFMKECEKHDFNTCLAGKTAIIPILVGSDENAYLLSNKLMEMGVFVPPAVYPAVPKGKARLRFCVISDHKPEQIVEAMNILEQAAKELNITLPPRD